MRLGKDTGSLVNHLMSGTSVIPLVVGMGATILHWTDRTAGTVVEVSKSGSTVVVREDRATLVGGSTLSEQQRYEYRPDENGRVWTFRRNAKGRWTSRGTGLRLGERETYRDPHF